MRRVDLAKIRKLREDKKLTQLFMAGKLGYKSSIGYHYIETGRCQIRAEQLAVIAAELCVGLEDLYVLNTTVLVDLKIKEQPVDTD